jgi:uncharacterized protein HemX
MASSEDFGARLERLEQRIEEMDRVESRSKADPSARVDARISPSGWLAVTGPVFAALALGFGLLWNAQQTNTSRMLELNETTNARMLELHKSTTAHLIELTRTTARLEATSERLEAAIDRLDGSVQKLSDQVERLSDRVDRLES